MSPTNEQYFVRSVERALNILQLFSNSDSELSASEISRRLDLPQSTAFRLLVTLAASGFVEQNPTNDKYRLGATCLGLGSAFLKHNDVRKRAVGPLERLRDTCGETVHLGVFKDDSVVYLEKLSGLHPIGLMSSTVGATAPAYCTGLGKALLAFQPPELVQEFITQSELSRFTKNTIVDREQLLDELNKIRRQGYSFDNEEHEQGVGCVAAPVFDHTGVVAAISIAGPVDRIADPQKMEEFIQLVKQTSSRISKMLGGELP
jgi:IclR family KDG regulon transcriptional repressor